MPSRPNRAISPCSQSNDCAAKLGRGKRPTGGVAEPKTDCVVLKRVAGTRGTCLLQQAPGVKPSSRTTRTRTAAPWLYIRISRGHPTRCYALTRAGFRRQKSCAALPTKSCCRRSWRRSAKRLRSGATQTTRVRRQPHAPCWHGGSRRRMQATRPTERRASFATTSRSEKRSRPSSGSTTCAARATNSTCCASTLWVRYRATCSTRTGRASWSRWRPAPARPRCCRC